MYLYFVMSKRLFETVASKVLSSDTGSFKQSLNTLLLIVPYLHKQLV